MAYTLQKIDPPSIELLHEMNEDALPHVNSVAASFFHDQLDGNGYFRAVYNEGRPAAFLLAMNETADYDSLNFLWFRDRYPRFIYIDRVVVGRDHRRAGLGVMLYEDLAAWAFSRTPRLACEVNTRPPNDPSLQFHRKMGFLPVGTQETDEGRKTVSLMVRELGGERREGERL